MVRKSVLAETGARYEAAYTPVEDYMLWMRLAPHTVFHNLQEVMIFLYIAPAYLPSNLNIVKF